jgi:hypothetical protein
MEYRKAYEIITIQTSRKNNWKNKEALAPASVLHRQNGSLSPIHYVHGKDDDGNSFSIMTNSRYPVPSTVLKF